MLWQPPAPPAAFPPAAVDGVVKTVNPEPSTADFRASDTLDSQSPGTLDGQVEMDQSLVLPSLVATAAGYEEALFSATVLAMLTYSGFTDTAAPSAQPVLLGAAHLAPALAPTRGPMQTSDTDQMLALPLTLTGPPMQTSDTEQMQAPDLIPAGAAMQTVHTDQMLTPDLTPGTALQSIDADETEIFSGSRALPSSFRTIHSSAASAAAFQPQSAVPGVDYSTYDDSCWKSHGSQLQLDDLPTSALTTAENPDAVETSAISQGAAVGLALLHSNHMQHHSMQLWLLGIKSALHWWCTPTYACPRCAAMPSVWAPLQQRALLTSCSSLHCTCCV